MIDPKTTPLALELRATLAKKDAHKSEHPQPHAFASEALNCNRKVALRVYHADEPYEESEKTLSGLISMQIGNFLHDHCQNALEAAYPGFQREATFDLGSVTGRADGLYTHPQTGELVVVEIKSMNERRFKQWEKCETPEPDHIMQGMLGCMAFNASLCHIIYIRQAGEANRFPLKEWILPYSHEDALMEYERLARIVEETVEGHIPEPWYKGDLIQDPESKYWPCGFCRQKDECITLGFGPISYPPLHQEAA